jgi:hypothetical protein
MSLRAALFWLVGAAAMVGGAGVCCGTVIGLTDITYVDADAGRPESSVPDSSAQDSCPTFVDDGGFACPVSACPLGDCCLVEDPNGLLYCRDGGTCLPGNFALRCTNGEQCTLPGMPAAVCCATMDSSGRYAHGTACVPATACDTGNGLQRILCDPAACDACPAGSGTCVVAREGQPEGQGVLPVSMAVYWCE